MIKNLKNKIAIILIICMVISLTPITSSAVSEINSVNEEYDGYIYMLRNGEFHTADTMQEIYQLVDKEDIELIEPNYIRELADYSYEPNDKYYRTENQKWIFETLAVRDVWKNNFYGKYNDKTPIVAVIDTGVEEHPDLKNTLPGVRYLDGEKVKYKGDLDTHGTFVAGIISAVNNNEVGITGVMPDVQIYPISVFKKKNGEIISEDIDLILGIQDAIKMGVDVINLSLGGYTMSKMEKAAIKTAVDHNVIVVAASGNKGNSSYFYPASFDNVISVSAIDINNKRAEFSNYNNKVDVAAPGKNIISSVPVEVGKDGKKYGYMRASGTSFSTAYVSGLAAMFKAINPNATAADFEQILKETSVDVGANGYDKYYGYGIANFANVYYKSLNITYPPKPVISKITKKKKALTISWKKMTDEQLTEVDAYQISYSEYPSFKNNKSIDVSGNAAVKHTIKGLKSKTKYYVRMRSIKENYFSKWSTIKSKKTK